MATSKHAYSIIPSLLLSFQLFVPEAYAETYWVDDDGTETNWAGCQNTVPMSGAAACTLMTANTHAAAADVVYLRAGIYSIDGYGIGPTNSGRAGSRLTFG